MLVHTEYKEGSPLKNLLTRRGMPILFLIATELNAFASIAKTAANGQPAYGSVCIRLTGY